MGSLCGAGNSFPELDPGYHWFESAYDPVMTFRCPLFPPPSFQFGGVMFFLRISDAEIGHETPLGRNVQQEAHMFGVKDGDPAKPDIVRLRRKPEAVNGHNGRPLYSLWHGHAPKSAPLCRIRVAEDGDMMRGFVEACQFEAGIGSAVTLALCCQSLGIPFGEFGFDCGTACGGVDPDEPPGWLSPTDGVTQVRASI